MKEVPVSKHDLMVAIILAVVIAAGILVIENWPLRTEQGSTPSTSEDNMAAKSPACVIAGPLVILIGAFISLAKIKANVVLPNPGGPESKM